MGYILNIKHYDAQAYFLPNHKLLEDKWEFEGFFSGEYD